MVEITRLYSKSQIIDIGDRVDNDPPYIEDINMYKIPNAYITPYGYIIKNLFFFKPTISYRHRNRHNFINALSIILRKKVIKTKDPAISITSGWYDSYYHFTLECLVKIFLLKKEVEKHPVVFHKEVKKFHKEWFEILGINNILYIDNKQVVKTKLAISSSFASRDLNHHSIIIPEFRSWVLTQVNPKKRDIYKKIFIGRKKSNHRVIVNNEEVKEALKHLGFLYLEMEDYDVRTQIEIFNSADQIVCAHGAALTNLCFCEPQTKVIDLMNSEFKQWCYLKLSLVLSLNYNILPCTAKNQKNILPDYLNITVDIDVLTSIVKKW